ncbi:MAG: hypothetical protein AB1440_01085 [Pseudomonadota bacterium]|jgi:hypothetical protein
MQLSLELMTKLEEVVDAIRAHLSEIEDYKLKALETRLAIHAPSASAEMVLLILVLRELQSRNPIA